MTGYSLKGKRVWVAGHGGMVGSAVVRRLEKEDCEILTVARADLDLKNQAETQAWTMRAKPDAVVLAAAHVGGILANARFPADFLYDNLVIETNVIDAAFRAGAAKLLFLGSSCIYPKFASRPIREEALLTAPLEPTNEWYAIAKIAGIKLCQAYRKQHGCDFNAAMPTNLYGPGDNFNLETSHVIPALIRKAHEAKIQSHKELVVWGSGKPRREFLHVDDCADAIAFLLKNYSGAEHVNVGRGEDVSIDTLAQTIVEIVGFEGKITHDLSKPDGTPQKLLSTEKLDGLGWTAKIGLKDGLRATYAWFVGQRY